MSDKVEIKKVLEFFDEWYKYYSGEAKNLKRKYYMMDPEYEAARDRIHCLVCCYRAQARVINSLKEMFELEFNFGLGVDKDD